MASMLVQTVGGLRCPAGGFTIDPHRPVTTAVLTHAHADHAQRGSGRYLCAEPLVPLVRARLGADTVVDGYPYGSEFTLGGVSVSFWPSGHTLGSAQVRIRGGGETWVVTGDYKREEDASCAPFEPVRCDVLITETTFALPVYQWPATSAITDAVVAWHRAAAATGRNVLLVAYSLGKTQRLLAMLRGRLAEPVVLHSSAVQLTRIYAESGVEMSAWVAGDEGRSNRVTGRIVIAPPGAAGSSWARGFRPASVAMASGWMLVRGQRRRAAVDRGFVCSDHVDWPGLLRTIDEVQPRRVLTTHGDGTALVRWLTERGIEADSVERALPWDDA
jgi:putative mRNA 3-end processing factor